MLALELAASLCTASVGPHGRLAKRALALGTAPARSHASIERHPAVLALALAASLGTASAAPAREIEVVGERDDRAPPGVHEIDVAARARPADGLEDVLATAPGVQIRRLGGLGAFAGISLRGTGFRQTLIRLDGVPLNPDGVEGVDLSQWPIAGLATIRIAPGAAPATAGAAPVGGVVDLHSGTAPGASAEIAAGAFGATRGALSGLARLGERADLLVAADALGTHGALRYHDDGGTLYDASDDAILRRANNHRRQGAALARLRVGEPGSRIVGLLSLAARDEGLPGPIGRPQRATALSTERALASLSAEQAVGGAVLGARLWGLTRRERLRDPDGELSRVPLEQRDLVRTLGGQLTATAAPTAAVAVRASVDAREEVFTRRIHGDATSARLARRFGVGGAIDAPLRPSEAVLVTPALHVRGLLAAKPGRDVAVAALPGLTVAWRPSAHTQAWASGSLGFRPPDLTEMYGDRGALVGNPDLRPERARRAELGARASTDGPRSVWGELSAWGTLARDAIGWLQNTQRTVMAVNFGQTRTLGASVAFGATLDERVGVDASLTLTHAAQTTADPTRHGRPVPFVAPARAWARGWVAPTSGLRLGVDLDHTAATPIDPHGLTWQPARPLLGAHVGLGGAGPITLGVDVRNLLGTRTGPVPLDPLGADPTRVPAPLTDFVGYPLPGRAAFVSVRFTPEPRP